MNDFRFPPPGSTPPDPDAEDGSESQESQLEPRDSESAARDTDVEPRESDFDPRGTEFEPPSTEVETRESEFESMDTELETWEAESETREAEPETRDIERETGDTELETRATELWRQGWGLEPRDSEFSRPESRVERRDASLETDPASQWAADPDDESQESDPGDEETSAGEVDSASPETGAESRAPKGGLLARLRKLDTRAPLPEIAESVPETQVSKPGVPEASVGLLQRLAGLERRRVPSHVFMIESGRLLYGRFSGETPPLTLTEFHQRELPAGLWPDGPLGGPARDPAALAEAVKALVAAASAPPTEASLVVPDAWLRLAFTELNELPRTGEERDAVLRWKLKGLTPFRVDELRVEAAPMLVPGVAKAKTKERGKETPDAEAGAADDDDAQDGDAQRVLIGFGVDRLLSQLEEVFDGAGVRVGQLVNSGLALGSLAGALDRGGALTALVYVRPEGYGLAFQHHDDLIFHRVKLRGGDTDILGQVHRDLMLTRSYLEENFPTLGLDALLLLAPESEQFRWMQWLGDGFEREALALRPQDLPLSVRDAVPENWLDTAPMLGAALGEY